MACDDGEVELGEHVIALTSDTAILARVAPTERFMADFIVREILCKLLSLTVTKREPRLTESKAFILLEGTVEAIETNYTESEEELQ